MIESVGKAKVCVLATGGTIGHRSKNGVAVMDFDPQALAAEIGLPDLALEFRHVLRKGSMNMMPEDWKTIAVAIAEAISDEARGVVVLHGTDTMHYTASALSFMLTGLSLPVVLTGSMLPGGDSGSDALPNLRDAVRVAAYSDIAEVCIVFSADLRRRRGVIIRGNRARKIHSCAINSFHSINIPPIGYVENGAIILTELTTNRRSSSRLILATNLEPNVVLVKLTPAITPDMLARHLTGAAGAVIEGTGIGHVKTDLHPAIAEFAKPTVIGTQTLYGGERLGIYDVDRQILDIPNIIPAGDMNSDTALVKLIWALGQNGDVKSLMRTNFAGEITA